MLILIIAVFVVLISAELIKGLSANGTPPVLQKYPWQMDLAYLSWNSIAYIRVVCFILAAFLLWQILPSLSVASAVLIGVLLSVWFAVMWLFNFYWVGKRKFDPLSNPKFVNAAENQVSLESQVMGTVADGEAKAYPVEMIAYHHQLQDQLADKAIWVTYCALCMSGRIYDRVVNGQALDFTLIGAITFNATFRDNQTGSWWRQEMGDAVKGPQTGTTLEDMFVEHMALRDWLKKHPDSKVLQYDPAYVPIYTRLSNILNGDAWFPNWHKQERWPMVVGVDLDGQARSYDLELVKSNRVINDQLGDASIVIFGSDDGRTTSGYHRQLGERNLDFSFQDGVFKDTQTSSEWNLFGQCVSGELAGSQLSSFQVRQQNLRSWTEFHPNTSFFGGA